MTTLHAPPIPGHSKHPCGCKNRTTAKKPFDVTCDRCALRIVRIAQTAGLYFKNMYDWTWKEVYADLEENNK